MFLSRIGYFLGLQLLQCTDNAAKYGYIDDVIEPRNTRFRIIRALQQLQTKKVTNPAKKHGNIPL